MSQNITFNKAFPDTIKQARRQHHYTQEKMAELADISVRWYQDLEKGEGCPRGDTLLRLVFVLEIDIAVFKNTFEAEE